MEEIAPAKPIEESAAGGEAPQEHAQSRRKKRSAAEQLRRASANITDMIFHPWFTFVMLVGLIVGFLSPKEGIAPPSCSMLLTSGVPCPSCGLTRATSCVLQGEFYGAWLYNPFGFAVAGIFLLLGPVTFFPARWKNWLKDAVRPYEVVVGVTFVVLVFGLFFFGVVRGIMVKSGMESQQWWLQSGTPEYIEQHYGSPPDSHFLARLRPLFPGYQMQKSDDQGNETDE